MLEKFRLAKEAEVRELMRLRDAGHVHAPWARPRPGFGAALTRSGSSGIIAEYKRASPSKGDINLGVTPAEAAPGRPSYRAGAGTQWQAGVNGAWPVGQRGSVLFGLMATRLGNAQAESPIVETRLQPLAYLGYGWTF